MHPCLVSDPSGSDGRRLVSGRGGTPWCDSKLRVLVGGTSFKRFQTSRPMDSIKRERIALNRLPGITIFDIRGTDSPGPHDYNSSSSRTLKLFEARDGGDDLRSCTILINETSQLLACTQQQPSCLLPWTGTLV